MTALVSRTKECCTCGECPDTEGDHQPPLTPELRQRKKFSWSRLIGRLDIDETCGKEPQYPAMLVIFC